MSDIMDLSRVYKYLVDSDTYDIAVMTMDTCNKISEELSAISKTFDETGAKLIDGKVVLPKGNEEVYQKLADLGILSIIAPEEFGGAGLPYSLYMTCVEIIARECASTAVGMCVHGTAIDLIRHFGTDEAKKKYLPPLASGEKLGLIAFTEPNSGSDLGSAQLKALLNDSGEYYVFNGVKQFITNGGYAKINIVLGLSDPGAGPKGLSSFVVDITEIDGFSVAKVEDKFGIKASPTSQLVFENSRIPKANLLGLENKGFRIVLTELNGGRISIASQATGIADAAYKKAFRYANERMQFGVTVNSFPAVREKLAMMGAKVYSARVCYLEAASLKDSGEDFVAQAAAAKLNASENAEYVCREAIQIHGGYGYCKEYEVERLYRDARITTIYEGTNEIIRFVISRDLMNDEGSSLINWTKKITEEIKDSDDFKDMVSDIDNATKEVEKYIDKVKKMEDKFARQFYCNAIVNMAAAVYNSAIALKYTVKSEGRWSAESKLLISEMKRDVKRFASEIDSDKSDIVKNFPVTEE